MSYYKNQDFIAESIGNEDLCQSSIKPENHKSKSISKSGNKQFSNNIKQKSESKGQLNYNSNPFIPKSTFPVKCNTKTLHSDVHSDSIGKTGPSNLDTTFLNHPGNSNYENYNRNMINPCMYNNFVPLWYQMPDPGIQSNCWPVTDSNYYVLSTLCPSDSLFSNQRKQSENSSNQNENSNSNIKNLDSNFDSLSLNSSQQKLPQNANKNYAQSIKSNSGNKPTETSVPWNNKLSANLLDEKESYKMEGNRYKEILNCISELQIRKNLAETIKYINPSQFHMSNLTNARFFVIKSYSEDDLHRAIKYSVWCSTQLGNQKLNAAYNELISDKNTGPGRLFLFFSVNGSGFFAGIAEMISYVNFNEKCGFWTQKKWIGKFGIKWHYLKDVKNSNLRHIRSEANDNKPVTNSRDTAEVTPFQNGIEFVKVFHQAKHETSVLDDFEHYERRQHTE